MSICTNMFRFAGDKTTLTCERTPVDDQGRHKGTHQAIVHVPAQTDRPAFDRLAQWSDGGASLSAAIDIASLPVCIECGGLYESQIDFNPAVAPLSPGANRIAQAPPSSGYCFHCSFWLREAAIHAEGWRREHGCLVRTIRPHDDSQGWREGGLYGWATGSSGAFGDRKVIVTWDDGDVRGPASSMWFSGRIPWEFDHLFPANATIEWVKR